MKNLYLKGLALVGIVATCLFVALGIVLPFVSYWYFIYSFVVMVSLPALTRLTEKLFEILNIE